jgi:hypothetical protein
MEDQNPCLKYCEKLLPSVYSRLDKECIESCKILYALLKDLIKAIEFECRLRHRKPSDTEFCLNFTLSILVSTISSYLDYILKH